MALVYGAHHGRLECVEKALLVEGARRDVPVDEALDVEATESRMALAAPDHAARVDRRRATHRPTKTAVEGSWILGRLVEEEELLGRERGHDVRLEPESSLLITRTTVPAQRLAGVPKTGESPTNSGVVDVEVVRGAKRFIVLLGRGLGRIDD